MLHLLSNNKAGQNITFNGSTFNLRDVFKTKEDSFTSSVFALLFYLPESIFWKILYYACYSPTFPVECGKLLSYEFWPHWDGRGTNNENHVEPDLFVNFENFHLLIEAKRYDFAMQQSRAQWEKEVIAYHNQLTVEERKPLYFLAVSGLPAGYEKQIPLNISCLDRPLPVNFARWRSILHEVKKQLHIISASSTEVRPGTSFILQDLLLAFRVHGFVTGDLLCTMSSKMDIKHQAVPGLLKKKGTKAVQWSTFPKDLRPIKHTFIKPL